jgi:ribose 5-phosphate isomerase A
MSEQREAEKKTAAEAALRFVKSGMLLGLGSGSTSHWFIKALGERARSGELRVEGIATSRDSEQLAREMGIPVIASRRGLMLDLDVDGADEIDPELNLIKGGGGALLREKVIARGSRYFLVLADSSKPVAKLGAFPLPVEVIPFTLNWVMDEVAKLGGEPVLRMKHGSSTEAYLTDQQNYILDCRFGAIESPAELAGRLEKIPGIAEHGLFLGYAKSALIARGAEVTVLRAGAKEEPLEHFAELP